MRYEHHEIVLQDPARPVLLRDYRIAIDDAGYVQAVDHDARRWIFSHTLVGLDRATGTRFERLVFVPGRR